MGAQIFNYIGRVGIEGAKAMEEEGWARFFITWEMVGIEGAEATEEGRGTIFE